MLSHAPEDLFHAQHEIGQIDALCPDPTVTERVRPIIVARGQGQAQHVHLRVRMLCTMFDGQRGCRGIRECMPKDYAIARWRVVMTESSNYRLANRP